MPKHLEVGKQGEELAETYLRQQGYTILGRNITNPQGKRLGEIDIVAQYQQEIVFVEVKTLATGLGRETYLPEHQVTRSKLQKLERIAAYYLKCHGLDERSYRFDVIAISLYQGREPQIRHIEHAFL